MSYANVRRSLPIFSTEAIAKQGDIFVAEASQFSNFRVARVWDDACDEGCFFQSHKTGKKVVFILVGIDKHDDEISGWRLESFGLPEKIEVLVIND